MIRIWLLAAGLVLGAAFTAAAHDEKKSRARKAMTMRLVKLTERQIEAGKFAVTEVARRRLEQTAFSFRARSCRAATISRA